MRLRSIAIRAIVLCYTSAYFSAQTPKSNGRPTELVVTKYERLVEQGAFLSARGWERASKIYDSAKPYDPDGTIFLMSTGGALGENWNDGAQAEVETKWTDYLGSVDRDLKYKAPQGPHVTMTGYQFKLRFTDTYRLLDPNGKLLRETVGQREWKVAGPLSTRWATIDKALAYVVNARNSTDNPVMKKNAERTIRILRKLGAACGSASAC